MNETQSPVQIADNLWRLGAATITNRMQCNAYLMIHGETAVLFEPGPASAGN